MPEGLLLLLRHAESTWNAVRRWQGHGDPPLSEAGLAQAEQAAARLAHEGVERLVASDLVRAATTARIVGARLRLEVELEPGWRERDVGRWSGLTRGEIRERFPDEYARYRAGDLDVRPGGGESGREFLARIRAAAGAIARAHPGRRVLVVTHRGAIRALVPELRAANAEWCRLPLEAAPERAGQEADPKGSADAQ
jgi:broad specificity phosphatase PhoE